MPNATYVIEADWAGDGGFAHANSDITADVMRADAVRGRDYASQLTGRASAGRMELVLRNDAGASVGAGGYSPNNTSSPLTGLLLPGRRIRWRVTSPVSETLWSGYIDRIVPTADGGWQRATIHARGPFVKLNRRVNIEPQVAVEAGAIIEAILDDAGIDSGDYDIDGGQTTFKRVWFWDKDALNAIREVEDSEFGFFYEARDGKLRFEDRHYRLTGDPLDSQATWSDAGGATIPYVSIEQEDPLREIYNHVRATVRYFTAQSVAVLWTLREASNPVISPGDTKTFWANYPPAGTPSGAYVDSWTTPDNTDVTVTGAAFADLAISVSKFAQSMKIEITNNGTVDATLTLLRARGAAVTEEEATVIEAEDTGSQDEYGRRSYDFPGKWLPTALEAQDFCDYIVSRFSEPVPVIAVSFSATRSSAVLEECLTRDISERVTVVAENNAELGLDADFYVECIRHVVDKGAASHRTTFMLSAADPQTYWALGEAGASELGETTRLSY